MKKIVSVILLTIFILTACPAFTACSEKPFAAEAEKFNNPFIINTDFTRNKCVNMKKIEFDGLKKLPVSFIEKNYKKYSPYEIQADNIYTYDVSGDVFGVKGEFYISCYDVTFNTEKKIKEFGSDDSDYLIMEIEESFRQYKIRLQTVCKKTGSSYKTLGFVTNEEYLIKNCERLSQFLKTDNTYKNIKYDIKTNDGVFELFNITAMFDLDRVIDIEAFDADTAVVLEQETCFVNSFGKVYLKILDIASGNVIYEETIWDGAEKWQNGSSLYMKNGAAALKIVNEYGNVTDERIYDKTGVCSQAPPPSAEWYETKINNEISILAYNNSIMLKKNGKISELFMPVPAEPYENASFLLPDKVTYGNVIFADAMGFIYSKNTHTELFDDYDEEYFYFGLNDMKSYPVVSRSYKNDGLWEKGIILEANGKLIPLNGTAAPDSPLILVKYSGAPSEITQITLDEKFLGGDIFTADYNEDSLTAAAADSYGCYAVFYADESVSISKELPPGTRITGASVSGNGGAVFYASGNPLYDAYIITAAP